MKPIFYKIECLTNLHVGSGDINYNVIDNEVEKDAVSGLPVIHASGVKGALRDALAKKYCENKVNMIFGAAGKGETGNSGTHKFLDACLLSRPMRVSGSDKIASVSVVTVDSVNRFLKKMSAFGVKPQNYPDNVTLDFGDNEFLVASNEDLQVEGEPTAKMSVELQTSFTWLKKLVGGTLAFVKSFDHYDLPVVARNCLDPKRGNLWYEEVVPHDSVLYFAVIYPEGDNIEELDFSDVIQFGGNASIGCGYTTVTRIG